MPLTLYITPKLHPTVAPRLPQVFTDAQLQFMRLLGHTESTIESEAATMKKDGKPPPPRKKKSEESEKN